MHCLTTGTPNPLSSTQVRREECLAAASLLGIDEYTFSSIPDTRLVEHRSAIHTTLSKVFRDTRPDVVYTHYPDDQHLDHVTTAAEVTAVALRETANLRYFRSPYSTGFEPTFVFMGTPELLRVKEKALRCFTSQQQLDMDVFQRLAEVTYRQFIHHRVVARFPAQVNCGELFQITRHVEFAEV
ncbi:PIG-L deacetylase family protein [Spirillospora sp. CA-128828]|uniref:PIG-L deacetylase family protein n=1 Tax=Spirillospora sp. CA-128828 TaxID=3240033 RepID=UPI003D8DB08E